MIQSPPRACTASTPVTRSIVITQRAERALIRVSLPFVALVAGHAGKTAPDVACCVLRRRLNAPLDVDINALNDAVPGFMTMLPHSVCVTGPAGGALSPVSMRMRLETEACHDQRSAADAPSPGMLSVMSDALYESEAKDSFRIALSDLRLPDGYHHVTDIQDRRGDRAVARSLIGDIGGPLSFTATGGAALRLH